uniref:Uncharacterized protein n=1 Tax=Panagrolaimus sp. JU765 TaxID=591449 RepID=A0AC34QHN0_9BILA
MCASRIIFIIAILVVLGYTHLIPKERPVLPEKSENDLLEKGMEEYSRAVVKEATVSVFEGNSTKIK